MKRITRRDAVSMSAAVLALAGCTDAINNGGGDERGDEPTVEPTDESELAPEETLKYGEWSQAPRDIAVAVDGFEIIREEVPAEVGEEGNNKLNEDEQLVIVDFRAKNISNEDRDATVDIYKRFGVFTDPDTYYGYGDLLNGPTVCEYGNCRDIHAEDMEVRKTELVGGNLAAGSIKKMWFPAPTDITPKSEISIRYDDRYRFHEEGAFFVEWQ